MNQLWALIVLFFYIIKYFYAYQNSYFSSVVKFLWKNFEKYFKKECWASSI